jgi:hypothetical protein
MFGLRDWIWKLCTYVTSTTRTGVEFKSIAHGGVKRGILFSHLNFPHYYFLKLASSYSHLWYMIWYIYVYLTTIGLTPGGSSTSHIYTQTLERTQNNTEKEKLGSAGRAPSLRVIPWHLPYNWVKSTEKRVRVAQYKNNETINGKCHRITKNTEYTTEKTVHYR